MIIKSIKQSVKFFSPFLKHSWLLLITIAIPSEITKKYFDFLTEASGEGTAGFYIAQLGKSMTILLVSLILLFIVPIRINELFLNQKKFTPWTEIAKQYGSKLLLEGFRALAVIIIWSLAFVIPGIYKQIRLSFVPFIVLFDPDYKAGKVDPLIRSHHLTKGIFFSLTFISILSFGIDFFFEIPTMFFATLNDPYISFVIGLIGVYASSFFCTVTYFLYQNSVSRLNSSFAN